MEILITVGIGHDNATMQMMDIDLHENNHLYADSAYLKQRFQRIIGKIATNSVQSGYPKEFSKKK